MKNKIILLWLILFLTGALQAQNDSITLRQAPWRCDTLNEMIFKSVHFSHKEFLKSNQYIAIVEIPHTAKLSLQLGYAPSRTKTSSLARQHNALAAINGSFFDMKRHQPICHLRINGNDLAENAPGADSLHRKYYQYGTLVFNHHDVRILRTDSARLWEGSLTDSNILTAGPLLLYHGEPQPIRNDRTFVNQRHNRSAIGIRPDGTILLFIVDGRTKESEGMTIDELTKTLSWLGCHNALNLDGGGSTTLYVKDFPNNGVVNYPSDNGIFDHRGERAVSNILMVVPAEN